MEMYNLRTVKLGWFPQNQHTFDLFDSHFSNVTAAVALHMTTFQPHKRICLAKDMEGECELSICCSFIILIILFSALLIGIEEESKYSVLPLQNLSTYPPLNQYAAVLLNDIAFVGNKSSQNLVTLTCTTRQPAPLLDQYCITSTTALLSSSNASLSSFSCISSFPLQFF